MALLPRSSLARDLLLGVVLTVVAEAELWVMAGEVDGSLAGHLLLNLLILPAVSIRRVSPLGSALVAAASMALQPVVGEAPVAAGFLVLLFVLASLGWHATTRHGLAGVAAVVAGGLVFDATSDDFLLADLVVNVVIIVATWAAGRGMRMASDRRVAAEVEADRAARQATLAERQRIAGELHDSLAHALTLMTLQAGSARERTDHPLAGEALAAIERTGRDALTDMQRFLALLDSPGTPDAPAIPDLPALVEKVSAGGLAVHLESEAGEVTAGISTTVYRVVQEALTNVVRHSDARSARVVVHRDGPILVTRVSDDGGSVEARTDGTGRGLNGLSERVRVFDGTVTSGRTANGWQVEARIPLGAAR